MRRLRDVDPANAGFALFLAGCLAATVMVLADVGTSGWPAVAVGACTVIGLLVWGRQ